MVTGIPPFFELDEEATKEKIKTGVFSCQYPNYVENTSKDLKELVENMVTVKDNRYTIDECVTHAWIQDNNKATLNKKVAVEAIACMRNVFFTYQFQKAVVAYMAKTLIDKKEKENLQVLFESFDEDRDGDISLTEFVVGFKSKFSIVVSEAEMSKIIRQLDMNGDRVISFTEFLMGACNKQALLSENNLRITFA